MGDVGFCTDVMEHIPPDDVETVLRNIMASTPRAFFQISTVEDVFGKTIGQPLHLSVHPHAWWMDTFRGLGLRVPFDQEGPISSCFMVVR